MLIAALLLAQIELFSDKASYAPGEPVVITLVNHGGTDIDFPFANWWRIVDVFGVTVFSLSGPPAVRPLLPGEALQEAWFQVDDALFPVPLGPYIIEATFIDLRTGGAVVLSQSIGVGGPPDPNIGFVPIYFPPPEVVVTVSGGGGGGSCGSVGLDLMLIPGALWLIRRRGRLLRSRPGRSRSRAACA